MTEAVRDSFRAQADICEAMGSALTAQVLRILAVTLTEGSALGARVLAWQGDPSAKGDALALRLAGGLHRIVLGGADKGLRAAYAGEAPLEAAVIQALRDHEAELSAALEFAPQTNEVRRSAVLIACGNWLAARFGLPLVLSELGASAGLNLIWDRFALRVGDTVLEPEDPVLSLMPDWRGRAPIVARPVVRDRAGVDLNPLDVQADRLRMLSYIWADQADRIERTILAADEVARLRPELTRADAVDWLETRLSTPMPGRLHLIYHTVAWQYFPAAAQARGEALLQAAGARASAEAPLAHFAMEADGGTPGAGLTLRLWPGNLRIEMGRADFHARWVDWQAPAPDGKA